MVVLGLDPGLERTGYGVVRREGSSLLALEHGVLTTPRLETPRRLAELYGRLREVVARTAPASAATERLFFAKNQTTVMDVAKAVGVAQLVLAQAGIPCLELSPPEVKLAVVGHGGAGKRQVQYMVQRILRLAEPPRPDDAADALAVAVALALKQPGP